MRRLVALLAIVCCIYTIGNAQVTTNRAIELMKLGQTNLEQKEYTKARYLFKQAYGAFAAQENYAKAVECGLQTVILYARENYYKEGFELCREMDQLILAGEQKLQKPLYDQRFNIIKERAQIYTKLKVAAEAKNQMDRLEEITNLAKSDSLNKDLLYTKANYFYAFGQPAQGDGCLRKLITQSKGEKNYEKVNECYRSIIEMAKRTNNAGLACRTYENFIVWTDSVKALTAQDELNVLKRKYDASLQTIQEKEDSLSAKQYMIAGLCVLVAILIAALIFIVIILLRFVAGNRKLKKSIQIANEHNELKTQFIQNISSQMEPTLDTLSASALELADKAPKQSEQMQAQVGALKKFSDDIQELSSLENSLTEPYELTEINVNTFCELTMDKIRECIHPEVATVVNAAKLQIKTNPEQLERILIHLLKNAALYTEEGRITLDFKKRGAHTHQFIVTDSGPGIPEEQQENLFKPFTEVKDLTQGDGLGLPICALIATKMNGSLTLDTSYTKGSRFILELHA